MANVDFGRYKRIVQFFWDPEPTINAASNTPVWCLGKEYRTSAKASPSLPGLLPTQSASSEYVDIQRPTKSDSAPDSTLSSVDSALTYESGSSANDGGWPSPFLDDFETRIWLTYRSNFPPIAKSQDPKAASSMSLSMRLRNQLVDQGGFTSDTGWGCMIRSGQSLLANSLLMLELGRDWRRGKSSFEERKLLSLFADDPRAPYSIHKFVQHGATACGKHPGEWFGPSATAQCIQYVSADDKCNIKSLTCFRALTNSQESSELRVYITGDGSDVYEDKFMAIAKADGVTFKPTLVLVGTRLGLDKITPVYWEALKSSLQMPQSIGIAGGRPSSSHYFIGVQDADFFYLDPHQTRPALPFPGNLDDYTQTDIDSCHTRRLRKIHINEMDPSMLLAFLIRDENDWKVWRRAVNEVQGKAVIHVADRDAAHDGVSRARESAIDEVETFDDEDVDDTILSA
ncbi:putative cysteine protease atg4 [Calycina marina]|uniref:Cysteine protease n=1 Tax=Calycina marina TaxID=1763456 RepID=A0A9P7Z9L9_9HELO|nr:putative cysteine protease atg4 [Calycina marina]